jgi:hypothetical protein
MANQTKLDKKTEERIALAREAATKMDRTFVAATFKTLTKYEGVKISIPGPTATHLKKVDAHKLLVFEGTALKNVMMIDISEHYVHGDLPVRDAEGKVKPSVVRHFYILPGYLGQEIAASVEVKEKTSLLTGEKMIIIDIVQIHASGFPVEVDAVLRLGAPSTGTAGEISIPGTDKCVRIEKITAVKIAA